MIKKFKDFISEGMWKSGLDRAKSGELRKEDVPNTNIADFEEVDLGMFVPFYFSSENLKLNDEENISFNTWREYKKQIEKSGWRMPTRHEWKNIIMKYCDMGVDFPNNSEYTAFLYPNYEKSNGNEKMVILDTKYKESSMQYWLEYDITEDDKIAYTFDIHMGSKFQKDIRHVINISGRDSVRYKIRLVKDKRPK